MLLRLLLYVWVSSAVWAQSGAIQGLVKDASEAVVAGASVTVTNLDTGLRRALTTNDQGFYTAPSLPVGRYKIMAAKPGFANAEVPEIKLDVGPRRSSSAPVTPSIQTDPPIGSAAQAAPEKEYTATDHAKSHAPHPAANHAGGPVSDSGPHAHRYPHPPHPAPI